MQESYLSHSFQILGDVVVTADGSLTLKDPSHGECFHSIMGASREARELYVEASGLHRLWNEPGPSDCLTLNTCQILDVGLGLGYNAVTTIQAWLTASHPTHLVIQSLEIDRQLVMALASGQAPWQANWQHDLVTLVQSLAPLNQESANAEPSDSSAWSTTIRHPSHACSLEWLIQLGDARIHPVIPADSRGWDYVWQDPFSPEKNPGMWSKEWFQTVRAGSHAETTLMTYSVARGVRDALSEAGWHWEKFPSHSGFKRHWLRAKPHSLDSSLPA